jgi:hypothetical protein
MMSGSETGSEGGGADRRRGPRDGDLATKTLNLVSRSSTSLGIADPPRNNTTE